MNPPNHQTPSAMLIVRLESWFCQEKQNSLFSVDWALKQKHLMTKTDQSGKVVSHYTNSAIHWPIVLQIEVCNLSSDLHPKKRHITIFKLLTMLCYRFLLQAVLIITLNRLSGEHSALHSCSSFPSFKTVKKHDIISGACPTCAS